MKKIILLSFVFLSTFLYSQESHGPSSVIRGRFVKKTIPLRDFATNVDIKVKEKSEEQIIENFLKGNRKVVEDALPLPGQSIAQRSLGGVRVADPEVNFEGANEDIGFATPPDPSGAIGPNHYVHGVNLIINIFDREGGLLVGPVPLGDFLESGNNSGDPIILYDQLEDRWFVSQFGAATNSLVLGVSETPDPTGSYLIYEFIFENFPDYPKYTVWDNAYYLTTNPVGGNPATANVNTFVIDKEALFDPNDPDPVIISFELPEVIRNTNSVFSPEPAHLLGTSLPEGAPGYIVYLQDDGWAGVDFDHLKVWEIEPDFENPDNSTISQPQVIPTQPFESTFAPFGTGDVEQPGTGQRIDIIQGVISYVANYRSFEDHNSWVITFNDDVDGNDTAGVRWIELRNQEIGQWSIFQEGTYAPDDGNNRFMGSAGIDAFGNIGLGFNIAGPNLQAGVRFTGRFEGDALGEMTVEETSIIEGNGIQTTTNRFGDYTQMTVDVDDFTFWFTAEYFSSDETWATRIASFRLASGLPNDVGVNAIISPIDGILSNNEQVEISIRNFGSESQSNFPIELVLDGSVVATEMFTGTVEPNETATFTFSQTIDLSIQGATFILQATTLLETDEFSPNDSFESTVTHLFNSDVGVTDFLSPQTGEGLSDEVVSVMVTNFGVDAQSNFEVQYILDNGNPVVETFTEVLDGGEQALFTFEQTVDLLDQGTFNLIAQTNLNTDQDNENDSTETDITNEVCSPSGTCAPGNGFVSFALGTIDNNTACSPGGFGDFTALNTDLMLGETHDVTVNSGFAGQLFSVWIDFNDNGVFEEDELLIEDALYDVPNVDITASFSLPEDFELKGTHLLRARMSFGGTDPTSTDPCIDFTFGETEDYTVTLTDVVLSVEEQLFNNGELTVFNVSDDVYEIRFATTGQFDNVGYSIFNILGQEVLNGDLDQQASTYGKQLDLGNLNTGVYLVRVFSDQFSTVRRVAVK